MEEVRGWGRVRKGARPGLAGSVILSPTCKGVFRPQLVLRNQKRLASAFLEPVYL